MKTKKTTEKNSSSKKCCGSRVKNYSSKVKDCK